MIGHGNGAARIFDLSHLLEVDPASLSEFQDAAAKGVRAEAEICGWYFVCSFSTGRTWPWRLSGRRVIDASSFEFATKFARDLGCPEGKPIMPHPDNNGFFHWGWG